MTPRSLLVPIVVAGVPGPRPHAPGRGGLDSSAAAMPCLGAQARPEPLRATPRRGLAPSAAARSSPANSAGARS